MQHILKQHTSRHVAATRASQSLLQSSRVQKNARWSGSREESGFMALRGIGKQRGLSSSASLWKPDDKVPPTLATAANTGVVNRIGSLEEQLREMNGVATPLAAKDPLSVIHWAKQEFQGRVAMSTSFGLQAAVLLHLATRVMPDIPVVWVDTGYLPPETYKYAEDLKEALDLNLIVSSNTEWTPARMEAVHGKLWEKDDPAAHALYGKMRKVVPLKTGLDSINPQPLALLSGLRAGQTKARANMEVVGYQHGRFKVLPMLRMTDKDVADYIDRFDLPKHPLQAKGYATVGDWHSSRPVKEGEDARATRFGGKFEECGLHVDEPSPTAAAPASGSSVTSTPSATSASAAATSSSSPSSSAAAALEAAVAAIPDSAATHAPPRHQVEPIQKGLEALSIVKSHPDTDLAVIMVKKILEDGSPCRKCDDVTNKIAKDNVERWIGHFAVANVTDSKSEGVLLAKHFDVATAPFFLVRTAEEEKNHLPWRAVRSYLQLKKILEAANEKVEEKRIASGTPRPDPKKEAEMHRIAELKAQITLLTAQLKQAEEGLRAL